MEEEWRDVPNYEGLYQVSNLGRVKSFARKYCIERILKTINSSKGYLIVNLCKNKKHKQFLVHRLVAEAFIPNPENKPCIDHIDTNKENNKITNLRWVTNKENNNNLTLKKYSRASKDKWQNPIIRRKMMESANKRRKPIVQLNMDYSFVRYWDSAYDVERELEYNHSNINSCLKGKYNSSNGYIGKTKKRSSINYYLFLIRFLESLEI